MGDALVIVMGVMDIIAGALISISFNFNTFSVIFGGLMVIKGAMSFVS